jgi:hypothetical protein
MSSALGTGVKLGGAINHLTLVVVSFGRCVVLGARVGCPPGLVVYWFSFCNGFSICAQKRKTLYNNPSEHHQYSNRHKNKEPNLRKWASEHHQYSNRHKNKEPNLRKWVDRTSLESLCKEREQTNGIIHVRYQ